MATAACREAYRSAAGPGRGTSARSKGAVGLRPGLVSMWSGLPKTAPRPSGRRAIPSLLPWVGPSMTTAACASRGPTAASMIGASATVREMSGCGRAAAEDVRALTGSVPAVPSLSGWQVGRGAYTAAKCTESSTLIGGSLS